MAKTASGLAAFVQKAFNEKWGYVWGTFGDRPLSDTYLKQKIAQYHKEVGGKESVIRNLWMGRVVADCVGLIKGFLWQNDTGAIKYNAATDYSTGTMYNAAKTKGTISTMPEIPGIGLYMSGHVGVYIGGGFAIESKGTAYGVVKTAVAGRGWTGWFCVPGVDYGTAQPTVPVKPAVTIPPIVRRGSKGANVRQLQSLLIQYGYKLPIYGVDGKFGAETEKAVISYQQNNGLLVDGIVDPETWGELLGVS